MKDIRLKMFVPALIVCLSLVSGNAQLRTPENVPIGFHGKVVDQQGNPISGAKVSFDLIVSHMMEDRTESTPMVMQTDQDGGFALTGVVGYGIEKIDVNKEGYELSPKTQRGYVFGFDANYKPNPDNPVVFQMWKKQGAERLVGSAWRGKMACDGTPVGFDLYHGSRNADGDLQITCTRLPLKSPAPGNAPFDYKFQIAVIGGGIQPTHDEFTYLAPEDGYSTSLTFSQKASDPNWDAKIPIPKDYYIKTSDGHYGRLFVDWYAAQNAPTHLEWDCSINPSGSRNLER